MTAVELQRGFVGLLLNRAVELGGSLEHLAWVRLRPEHLVGRPARVFAAILELHRRGEPISVTSAYAEAQRRRRDPELRLSDLLGWMIDCIDFDLGSICRVAAELLDADIQARVDDITVRVRAADENRAAVTWKDDLRALADELRKVVAV